ncbi:MAG: lamin tail domain-containing protein, partial [Anaerolineae bacterium]|nr:lamin tail domain-containing protein [Anaerolineae bacterium]
MSEDVAGVQSAFRRWRARRSLARFLFSIWFVALPACRPFGRGASPPAQVVISEFVAVNDGATIDEDGDASDWVELYNQGPTDVDLTGWYLTDERRDPVRWQFPQVILPANGYLVVFASGKDRAAAGSELHANFSLSGEGEYLGLFAPDGRTVVWEYGPHYPPQYEGAAYGLVAARQARYFTAPTPGAANGSASENQGPVLSNVAHHPAVPAPGQDVAVTVRAAGALAPLKAVTLYWRVMYGATQATPMRDDGAHEEGDAGDGVYGATIPSSLHEPGQMVRYYVVATDRRGQDARWPLRGEGTGGPHYCGTMIADPAVQSELPVLYWFVADPAAAETDAGSRASVFYDGVLYDNVLVRLRGLTARYWPKKSLKFDFNQGYHFRYAPDQAPVEEFNLNATVTDKSYLRQVLSWEAYRDAGVPSSISFPVRVQRNGRFYSVAVFVEQPDERYLLRQGLDPEGALYKMLKRNLLDSA